MSTSTDTSIPRGFRALQNSEAAIASCESMEVVGRARLGATADLVVIHLVLRFHARPEVPVHRASIAVVVHGEVRSAVTVRSEVLTPLVGTLDSLARDIAQASRGARGGMPVPTVRPAHACSSVPSMNAHRRAV